MYWNFVAIDGVIKNQLAFFLVIIRMYRSILNENVYILLSAKPYIYLHVSFKEFVNIICTQPQDAQHTKEYSTYAILLARKLVIFYWMK
jgi:hypothetical protein